MGRRTEMELYYQSINRLSVFVSHPIIESREMLYMHRQHIPSQKTSSGNSAKLRAWINVNRSPLEWNENRDVLSWSKSSGPIPIERWYADAVAAHGLAVMFKHGREWYLRAQSGGGSKRVVELALARL